MRPLLVFSLVGFWPVAIYLLVWGLGLLLNVAISAASRDATSASSAGFFIYGVLSWIAPILFVLAGHELFSRAASWRRRGYVLYATWLVIALVMAFVFSAAIGGVSMAAVEGGAGSARSRRSLYGGSAILIVAWAHAVIVPWVLASLFLLKRINQRARLWR